MDSVVRVTARLASLLVGVAWLGGCEVVLDGFGTREPKPVPAPAVRAAASGPSKVMFHEALDAIAQARCEQERRCNRVSEGARYDTTQACRTTVRNGVSGEMIPSQCPVGVDPRGLAVCLKALRDEGCGDPSTGVNRFPQCQTSAICPTS